MQIIIFYLSGINKQEFITTVATSCGQIPKTSRPGLCPQEVLDGCSVPRLLQNSTTSTISTLLQELISLLWMATNSGSKIRTSLQYGPRQTIATDAETSHPSWMSMKNLKTLLKLSMLWEIKLPGPFLIKPLFHISCEQREFSLEKLYTYNIPNLLIRAVAFLCDCFIMVFKNIKSSN